MGIFSQKQNASSNPVEFWSMALNVREDDVLLCSFLRHLIRFAVNDNRDSVLHPKWNFLCYAYACIEEMNTYCSLRIFMKTFVPQRWIEPLTINSKYYLFSRVYSSWLRFWFSRMNIYANVKVKVMLTEWCSSIEYRVVHSEHVVRWRLHIACKGLAWILQKRCTNYILIYSRLLVITSSDFQ